MKALRQREGFSLVEILTVLAIMGVLSALVTTVSQKAREYASVAKCTENLRQLVAANYLYAADHHGYFAPAMDASNRVRWHGKRTSTARPYDMSAGYLSPYFYGGEGITRSASSGAYDKDDPYAGKGKQLECPAFYNYEQSASSFEKGAGSYGYNMAYIGGQPGDQFSAIPITLLQNPSRTLMFADTAFPAGSRIQEYPFAEPFYEVKADGTLGVALTASIHFRHNGRANIAWADGHVSMEAPSKLDNKTLQTGWIGPSEDNGVWNSGYSQ